MTTKSLKVTEEDWTAVRAFCIDRGEPLHEFVAKAIQSRMAFMIRQENRQAKNGE